MKPRYEIASPEVYDMLKQATDLEERLDVLEKQAKCPDCNMTKMDCMMKGGCGTMEKAGMAEKDKYCMKNFGKKHSECSDKQKAQCDKACGKVAKASYQTTFSTEPGGVEFHSETGGQTRNAGYSTNQHLLDSTDVANKGATSESVSLDSLSPKMNTHDRASVGHVTEG